MYPAEIFFDPQSHTSREIAFETFLNGFHSAMEVTTTATSPRCP